MTRLCYISAMLIETAGPRIRLVQPRSFAGLMSLYAANHARLRQLLGDLHALPSTLVSNSPTDLKIYLKVGTRSRYTTSVRMTYWLNVNGGWCRTPDLELRIYHDARLVEALNCHAQPSAAGADRNAAAPRSELLRRWNLNMLLHKWLEHCLDHRHCFAMSQAQLAGVA
ncbi:MAG TPA: DUF1249 domain-containing protein [Gammaproteobacteria bacterium]|nr:DUF1249 domain-containing protein [Gammaproteobacteria bacterium]